MTHEENFETYLKEKYANEEKEQTTETHKPNFRVGFLKFLQKGKHEEDNSSQELDNFIAVKRSSNTVKYKGKTNSRVLRTAGQWKF